jgi:eukaryotic-like serine/threonine-protein kinase
VVLAAAVFGAITLTRHHTDEHTKAAAPEPVSTTPTPPPPPPAPLPVKVLNGLLPPPEEVAQIMGASQLAVWKSIDTLIDETPVIDNKSCIGAFSPGENSVYGDTGWTAARLQAVHEPGPVPISFEVVQAVVEFPTAEEAQKVLSDQTTQWSACAGKHFTLTYPGIAPAPWTFGSLTKTDNTIAMIQRFNGPAMGTGVCQRALEVRNNVVADVWVCRVSILNQGVDLANAIIAKLPH